jgi:hypothetical protein
MISYEEYKKLNNIENNQYIEFLDVSSWKENNRKNRPHTTNNSDTPTIYPLQNLKSFLKLKKNTKLR